MKHFLWIMPATLLALPTMAQETPNEAIDCNANEKSAIDELICSDAGLVADDKALSNVWQTWENGINANRMEYLQDEQAQWMNARSKCLDDEEPTNCLSSRYVERIRVLTSPRIFQRDIEMNGAIYSQRAAMTPISYNALNLQKGIEDFSFASGLIEDFQTQVLAPSDDECPLCTTEIESFYQIGFESPQLVILNCAMNEKHEDSEVVQSYEMKLFDLNAGGELDFTALFDASTAPFAKNAIIEQILSELDRINRTVEGNENGDKQYYWAETEINLNAMSNEDWNRMGFVPMVADGKIAGFSYRSDDFEFAPMGSTNYFSGFEIPDSNFTPYLKPEYSSFFN